jgi:hypothetical protein
MEVEFDWKDDYLSTVSLMIKVMGPDLSNFNEDLKEEFKDCLEDWHIDRICFYENLLDDQKIVLSQYYYPEYKDIRNEHFTGNEKMFHYLGLWQIETQ